MKNYLVGARAKLITLVTGRFSVGPEDEACANSTSPKCHIAPIHIQLMYEHIYCQSFAHAGHYTKQVYNKMEYYLFLLLAIALYFGKSTYKSQTCYKMFCIVTPLPWVVVDLHMHTQYAIAPHYNYGALLMTAGKTHIHAVCTKS